MHCGWKPGADDQDRGSDVGKNKETERAENDYAVGIERVTPLSDYIVVNISSPNTEGLRFAGAGKSVAITRRVMKPAHARFLMAVKCHRSW